MALLSWHGQVQDRSGRGSGVGKGGLVRDWGRGWSATAGAAMQTANCNCKWSLSVACAPSLVPLPTSLPHCDCDCDCDCDIVGGNWELVGGVALPACVWLWLHSSVHTRRQAVYYLPIAKLLSSSTCGRTWRSAAQRSAEQSNTLTP